MNVNMLIDRLNERAAERHAWLAEAAEQIRQWREEDAATGIIWERDGDGNAAGGNPAPEEK